MHREEQKGGEVDLSLCNVHKERQGKKKDKERIVRRPEVGKDEERSTGEKNT